MSSNILSSIPSTSSQSSAMEGIEFSSSPPASSPGISLPTTPSPRPRGTASDFIKVDWKLWGRQEWANWPGFVRYTGGQDTRAWWQQFGYRVEDRSTSRPGNKLKWICADCFARGFKKKSDFCFVCSTGAAIKKHLRQAHGILVSVFHACASRAQLDNMSSHLAGSKRSCPRHGSFISRSPENYPLHRRRC